jgi:hypothetical protein
MTRRRQIFAAQAAKQREEILREREEILRDFWEASVDIRFVDCKVCEEEDGEVFILGTVPAGSAVSSIDVSIDDGVISADIKTIKDVTPVTNKIKGKKR